MTVCILHAWVPMFCSIRKWPCPAYMSYCVLNICMSILHSAAPLTLQWYIALPCIHEHCMHHMTCTACVTWHALHAPHDMHCMRHLTYTACITWHALHASRDRLTHFFLTLEVSEMIEKVNSEKTTDKIIRNPLFRTRPCWLHHWERSIHLLPSTLHCLNFCNYCAFKKKN